MNTPTPMNDSARDDRFNKALDRLLAGDPTGIDEIEPGLQDIAIHMVQLANSAGWIGTDPATPTIVTSPWWRNSKTVVNLIAAVMVIGLVGLMIAYGVREIGPNLRQLGFDGQSSGICAREPRSNSEIAGIVRKTEARVEPFHSQGDSREFTTAGEETTRGWNACLIQGEYHRAMAYESEFFIWRLGQEVFPEGTRGLTEDAVGDAVAERHAQIAPFADVEDQQFHIYNVDMFRYNLVTNGANLRGADLWLIPLDSDGEWMSLPTVVSLEWDGAHWSIVSATRDGVPNSPYFRDDAIPTMTTPEADQGRSTRRNSELFDNVSARPYP